MYIPIRHMALKIIIPVKKTKNPFNFNLTQGTGLELELN